MTAPIPLGRHYAKRQVRRDEGGKLKPKEDKRRSPVGLTGIALISITFAVTDSDGEVLRCSTLGLGPTPEAALASWKSEYPALAADYVDHVILSVFNPTTFRRNDPLMGPKVLVSDPLLERFARGMRMGERMT